MSNFRIIRGFIVNSIFNCLSLLLLYYVHDTAWLINFDDFMSKINPQGKQVKCEMPLLRNKHDSLIRFNRTHKYAVDKHTIDRCTASDNVSKFLHGRIWIINYRELEKEIERRVEEGSEKKREKLWIRYNKFRKLKKCIQKNRHVSKTLIEWNKQKTTFKGVLQHV